eukprot:gene10230-13762_t
MSLHYRTTNAQHQDSQQNPYSGFGVRSSKGHTSRPGSAGATRNSSKQGQTNAQSQQNNSNNANYVFVNHGNPAVVTTTTLLTHGGYGINTTAQTQQQQQQKQSRPSSAGYVRPTVINPTPPGPPSSNPNQPLNNNQYYSTNNPVIIPSSSSTNSQQQPQPNTAAPVVAGYARPKSAGTNRRNDSPSYFTLLGGSNNNIVQNNTNQQTYTPVNQTSTITINQHNIANSQPPQSNSTQPNPVSSNRIEIQPQYQYTPGYNTVNVASNTTSARPLSANATSQTSSRNFAVTTGVEHWNTAYKLQYGQNTAVGVAPANNTTPFIPNFQTVPQNDNKPTSIPTAKLRQAVDLSYRYNETDAEEANRIANTNIPVPTVNPTTATNEATADNNDEDGEGLDLDGLGAPGNFENKRNSSKHQVRIATAAMEEDDEMDGKPINDSRSHPEVSTATPSLELGGYVASGSLGAVDARNTSLDSFSEENINIGLTTVPNQFCTKRDAVDLRKLLILSAGTRGGIVPSSSAVMDMYMVGKVVGVGSYGKVRAAWHRLTAAKVAIKTYDKSKLKDPAHWKRVHSEIKIMEQISHPRIARMYEAVETPKRMHLIMECLDGGNLCSYVKAKKRLSEEESKRIFFQILQAIDHLHTLGVSHRDVKLENVLFVDDKDIKLIDFGFSTVCQPGKKLKVFCGTPSYMAPEIVRRLEYEGKPVDIWSMGILLYALLCGCFPFRAKAYPDLYRRIARGTFAIPEELSSQVKDLLRQLLTVDPALRITAHAALRHSWLQIPLMNAPNMDKLRHDTPILISDKSADDLDEQVISEITVFGMSRDEVIRQVVTKTHSSLATLYYLLLDTVMTRRKATVAATKKSNPYAVGSLTQKVKPNTNPVPLSQVVQTGIITSTQQLQQNSGTSSNGTSSKPRATSTNPVDVYNHNHNHQQQNEADGSSGQNDYRYRPKSASINRTGTSGQRPLSAFAGRR